MLEAILAFTVTRAIVRLFLESIAINGDAFAYILIAAIIIGVLMMVAMPNKKSGMVIFVGSVSAYVLAVEMVPYIGTISSWAGIIAAIVAVISVKVGTYRVLHRAHARQHSWHNFWVYLL